MSARLSTGPSQQVRRRPRAAGRRARGSVARRPRTRSRPGRSAKANASSGPAHHGCVVVADRQRRAHVVREQREVRPASASPDDIPDGALPARLGVVARGVARDSPRWSRTGSCDASNSSMRVGDDAGRGLAGSVGVATPVRADVQLVAHGHVVDRVVVPVQRRRRAVRVEARRHRRARGPASRWRGPSRTGRCGGRARRPGAARYGSSPCPRYTVGARPARSRRRARDRRDARGQRARVPPRGRRTRRGPARAASSAGCRRAAAPKASSPRAATLRQLGRAAPRGRRRRSSGSTGRARCTT